MKRGGGQQKGSAFEREICKKLSLWWTYNENDNVFWRTAGSGARATGRAKRGQETAVGAGDITYIDEIGADLLKVFCFELKCGYGQWCALDLIDRKSRFFSSMVIADFWKQARESAEQVKAKFPVVIFKRDRKMPGIVFPKKIKNTLLINGVLWLKRYAFIQTVIGGDFVLIMRLDEFLEWCTPSCVTDFLM